MSSASIGDIWNFQKSYSLELPLNLSGGRSPGWHGHQCLVRGHETQTLDLGRNNFHAKVELVGRALIFSASSREIACELTHGWSNCIKSGSTWRSVPTPPPREDDLMVCGSFFGPNMKTYEISACNTGEDCHKE